MTAAKNRGAGIVLCISQFATSGRADESDNRHENQKDVRRTAQPSRCKAERAEMLGPSRGVESRRRNSAGFQKTGQYSVAAVKPLSGYPT